MASIYDTDLPRTEANFAPFTPLAFIQRTAEVYPDKLAIVHGELRQNWAQTYDRCRQLASALQKHGIGKNDTVAAMLPKTPRPWPSCWTTARPRPSSSTPSSRAS